MDGEEPRPGMDGAERAAELDGVRAAGLGESQRAILERLKRRGRLTIPELADSVGLNVETVRDHMKALAGHDLVRREGTRSRGRGRPEIVWGLTGLAGDLFPRREGELLRGLAEHLRETGHEGLLDEFFDRLIGDRRAEAQSRVEHLEGRARLEEAARILTELGFMAEVVEAEAGSVAGLRLCHCPIRELVEATKVPCRAEVGFVKALLGERLARVSYIPSGDASCSYRAEGP